MGGPAIEAGTAAGEWDWKLEAPPRHAGVERNQASWLEEAQAFRAREFYGDEGRTDAPATDADALDPESFHILARRSGELVGCIRMTFGLGRQRGLEFFEDLGFRNARTWPDRIFEGPIASRWATARGHRSLALAFRLAAGAYALTRHFGLGRIHAATATAAGQDRILMRSGARPAFELGGPVLSARFAQHTYMLCLDPLAAKPTFEGLIREMGFALGLSGPGMRRAA